MLDQMVFSDLKGSSSWLSSLAIDLTYLPNVSGAIQPPSSVATIQCMSVCRVTRVEGWNAGRGWKGGMQEGGGDET